MKMQITAERGPIDKGKIVNIWYFGASSVFGDRPEKFWTFGADNGEATYQIDMAGAEIVDPSLDGLVFKASAYFPSSFIVHRVLAEDEELYEAVFEFDRSAYAEFHRRRKLMEAGMDWRA